MDQRAESLKLHVLDVWKDAHGPLDEWWSRRFLDSPSLLRLVRAVDHDDVPLSLLEEVIKANPRLEDCLSMLGLGLTRCDDCGEVLEELADFHAPLYCETHRRRLPV